MEPVYCQSFLINDMAVDRYGKLKPSALLFFAQEIAGQHCRLLSVDYDTLASRHMFWAVIRNRVFITRLPRRGETIRVQTWPMPTTRASFPRSVVAYDEGGRELFRCVSLWVLMDTENRNMILPGKSGITVEGCLMGNELAAPGSLTPGKLNNCRSRTVSYTDLDRNGHMNNTRYFDWIDDLLPSAFHRGNRIQEMTICYYAEGREGQELELRWDFLEDGNFQVDALRTAEEKTERVFSTRIRWTGDNM